MGSITDAVVHRRRFLQVLVGSPLFAYTGRPAIFERDGAGMAWAAEGSDLHTASEALNIFDLEKVAVKGD